MRSGPTAKLVVPRPTKPGLSREAAAAFRKTLATLDKALAAGLSSEFAAKAALANASDAEIERLARHQRAAIGWYARLNARRAE